MRNAPYGGPRLRPSLVVVLTLAPIAAAHGTGLSADRSSDALFADVTGLSPRGAPV